MATKGPNDPVYINSLLEDVNAKLKVFTEQLAGEVKDITDARNKPQSPNIMALIGVFDVSIKMLNNNINILTQAKAELTKLKATLEKSPEKSERPSPKA